MRSRGFTLVELVVTLVLLAILAGGVSSYLGLGARMYSEAAEREQVLGQSRFVAERLLRELRNAVPNSVLLAAAGDCLSFSPLLYSGSYISLPFDSATDDMVVISEDLAAVSPVTFAPGSQPKVVVYPRNVSDIYAPGATSGAAVALAEVSTVDAVNRRYRLHLANASFRFARQSPERRFYIAGAPVTYCPVADGAGGYNLRRNGILMAEGLRSNSIFRVSEAVLNRNSVVNVFLQFGTVNNPDMVFNYEVHIPNVP